MIASVNMLQNSRPHHISQISLRTEGIQERVEPTPHLKYLKTDQPTVTHNESHSDSDPGMLGSEASPGAVMEGVLLLPEWHANLIE